MKKNIILIGLQYDTNLGDQVIFKASKEYLSRALIKEGLTEVEIREVDMTGREEIGKNATRKKCRELFRFQKFEAITRNYHHISERYLDYLTAHTHIRKYVDNNTIAIIFAGGGLLKYKVQNLPVFIDEVTKIASSKNIPVMFSSVGVEGFDKHDKHCLQLKRALNRSVVKSITTRDDIVTLNSFYRTKGQKTACVADPACAINTIFPFVKKRNGLVKTIGLGFVREDLFEEYGVDIQPNDLLKLWADLFTMLLERGYKCKVFCNGAKNEYSFIIKWAEYMGFTEEQKEEIILKRPETAEELVKTICCFDGLIVARLHASIIAYSYSIPFAALVWNKKQVFFGKKIGYPERFIEKDNINSEYIISVLEQAIKDGYSDADREAYCKTTETELHTFIKNYIVPAVYGNKELI